MNSKRTGIDLNMPGLILMPLCRLVTNTAQRECRTNSGANSLGLARSVHARGKLIRQVIFSPLDSP